MLIVLEIPSLHQEELDPLPCLKLRSSTLSPLSFLPFRSLLYVSGRRGLRRLSRTLSVECVLFLFLCWPVLIMHVF